MSEMRSINTFKQNQRVPNDNEFAQRDYNEFRKYFKDYPELNKLKNSIEWDVFWKIVNEIAVKAGIDPKQLNVLNKNSIIGIDGFPRTQEDNIDTLGVYAPHLNAILINYDLIKKTAKDEKVSEDLTAIHSIFHELVHSFSNFQFTHKELTVGHDTVGAVSTNMGYYSSDVAVGIRRDQVVYSNGTKKFQLVNEAVTENLSNDIFSEYLQRTGSYSKNEIDTYQKTLNESEFYIYNELVRGLKKMCDMVGKKTGVQGNIVWQGFIRGIFYNKTLEDKTIKKWFADAFSPTFLDTLSELKEIEDFSTLMKAYGIL